MLIGNNPSHKTHTDLFCCIVWKSQLEKFFEKFSARATPPSLHAWYLSARFSALFFFLFGHRQGDCTSNHLVLSLKRPLRVRHVLCSAWHVFDDVVIQDRNSGTGTRNFEISTVWYEKCFYCPVQSTLPKLSHKYHVKSPKYLSGNSRKISKYLKTKF